MTCLVVIFVVEGRRKNQMVRMDLGWTMQVLFVWDMQRMARAKLREVDGKVGRQGRN